MEGPPHDPPLRESVRSSVYRLSFIATAKMFPKELPMTPEEVRILYDYNAWANHRQMNAASALTPEQFTKPLGSSFSSVRDTLAHICGAEWIWLERFQGRSPASLPDTTQFKDVAS